MRPAALQTRVLAVSDQGQGRPWSWRCPQPTRA